MDRRLLLGPISAALLLSACAGPGPQQQPATAPSSVATSLPSSGVQTTPSAAPAPDKSSLAFTNENGTKQTFEQLKASTRLGAYDYGNGSEALEAFFEVHMNNMTHYNPTVDEVKGILGLNEQGRVGLDEFIKVSKLRNAAFDHLYDTPGGDLYNAMQEVSEVNLKNWYTSLEDPTKPYDPMSIEYDPINAVISLSRSTGTSKYKVTGPDLSKPLSRDPQYVISHRTNFTPLK